MALDEAWKHLYLLHLCFSSVCLFPIRIEFLAALFSDIKPYFGAFL